MMLTLEFAGEVLQDAQRLPNGLLKRLILDSLSDTNASLIIFGTRSGIFNQNNPNYKPILEASIKKYNLNDYPEKEQPSILLSKAEESFYHAETIASAAKIIELE
jgi:hypothetical protein